MDILESIYLAHRLYQVCNLSQLQLGHKSWSLVRCRPLEWYSICVLLISICLLFYGLFADEDFNDANNNETGHTVDFIQLIGIRVANIFSVLETMLRRNEQQKFYEKVREIDHIFECSLNVGVDNSAFRRKTLQRGAMMLTVYMSSELFILGTMLSGPNPKFSIYWIYYLLPFVICSVRYFQIFTSISIIKQRFDRLIASLEEVNLNQSSRKISFISLPTIKMIKPSVPIFETTERMNRRFDMENSEVQKLLIIRDLYNRLWELTCILNRCVGISVLINVANDFVSITSNCYWIFLSFKEYSSTYFDFIKIAGSTVWSIPHLCNVLVLAVLCDRTVQSTTNMALALHRIEIDNMNDNHNTVIEQFSLQLLHQKISFTAAGFFNVDCTLLYTIVGATTTYLIILIQFHMSENGTTP